MANIKISALAPAILPLDGPNTFFEVQTIEAGVDVSRKVASDDLTLVGTITIEEEGVPLVTGADTLDFVGAGVTASGAGSTKTITIPGPVAGTLAGLTDVDLTGQGQNDLLVNVGAGNWEDTGGKLTYDPVAGVFSIVDPLSADTFSITPDGTDVLLDVGAHTGMNFDGASLWRFRGGGSINIRDGGGLTILDGPNTEFGTLTHTTTDFLISSSNGSGIALNMNDGDRLLINQTIFQVEKVAAIADVAGHGQWWVRNDIPNTPMFTDDVGTDFVLNASLVIPNPLIITGTGIVAPITGEPYDYDAELIFENANNLDTARVGWDGVSTFRMETLAREAQMELLGTTTAGASILYAELDPDNVLAWELVPAGGGIRIGRDLGFAITLTATNPPTCNLGNVNGLYQLSGVTVLSGLSNEARLHSSGVASFETDAAGARVLLGSMFYVEKAAAAIDVPGDGQVWVRSDTPNSLMFTDDAGTDFVIGGSLVSFLSATQPTATITGAWTFTNTGGVDFDPSCELSFRNNADTSETFFQNLGPTMQIGIAGADFGSGVFEISQSSFAHVLCPVLFIGEQAAAEADIAGDGQVWVRNDVPNTLMFTDDTGNDFVVSGFSVAREKATTETTISDIVLSDDAELTMTLPIGTYRIHLIAVLSANVDGSMGIQYRLNFTGSLARSRFMQQNRINNADAQRNMTFVNSTSNYATITTTGASDYLDIEGILVVTVAGVLSFQWAQQSSVAQNLSINNTSSLTADLIRE